MNITYEPIKEKYCEDYCLCCGKKLETEEEQEVGFCEECQRKFQED